MVFALGIKNIGRLFGAALIFAAAPVKADDSNFVSTFVQANGGCSEHAPLMNFEYGARNASVPFGKPAEEWTDDDLKALKNTMAKCLRNPNGFDLSQENQILKSVTESVEDGRRSRQNQVRQAEAAQKVAEEREAAKIKHDRERAEAQIRRDRERTRRREEAAALRELQGFSGHIMSEAERERAQQLRETVPSFSARIDTLLLNQSTLRREAEEQRKRQEEREEAARRIKAEEAKRLVAQKRAEQEAEIEADRKREAFANSLPRSCMEARNGDAELETGPAHKNFERAAALAEAGDIKAACTTFRDYAAKLETVRTSLVQCTKDLDANLDDLARDTAQRALNRATEIYANQKLLKQKTAEMSCR